MAFMFDVYARLIVGQRVIKTLHTDFVLDVLQRTLYDRQHDHEPYDSPFGSRIEKRHHSVHRMARRDRHLQSAAVATVTITRCLRSINGLYKTELIHRRAPWRSREAVESTTLSWVS